MGRPGFPHALVAFCALAALPARASADEPAPPPPAAERPLELEELLSFLRKRNAERYAIRAPAGIDEARYLTIGGIEQWVTVRGRDRRNPVLLLLHGGPGDVTTPWSYAILEAWERRFTIVQWDQRGAGRTLRASGRAIAPTISVERLVDDGIEIVERVREQLGKRKVVLLGHSFGSILGIRMARRRPDLFHAYVGTAQVADAARAPAVAYAALLARARRAGDERALADLRRVGPPPYASGEGYAVQRRWANAFEGADTFLSSTIGLALVAPGGSTQALLDSAEGQMLSAGKLVPETATLRPADLGLELAVPVVFIQGADDFTTPTELARRYLEAIKAPRKAFVSLEGAGHFAVFMEPRRFLTELVRRVAPLARDE
jgi:pimeloyl-ACP methyl ester carboxylesterase